MSKKFVTKLVATVMAMTMVVGMGMTAFAEELPPGPPTPCEGEHSWSDWAASCHEGVEWRQCSACYEYEERTVSVSVTDPEPERSIEEIITAEVTAAVEIATTAETSLPVTAFAAPAPAAVSESLPAGTYNMSKIKTTKGFISAVNKIAESNPAPEVTVYAKDPIAFNNDSLAAVAKSGKALTYVFNYGGHVYSVTIPAGANVNGLLGDSRFAGPLYIGSLFGTTKVVK